MTGIEIFWFLLVLLIFLKWLIQVLNKNKQFYEKIPGPSTLPLFGNVLSVTSTTEILNALMTWTKDYGQIYKVYLGPIRKVLVVSDYKFLEHILSSTKILNKSEDYLFLRPWLGTGLLTSDGPKWKKHRKILTPAFHFQILEQFVEIFENKGTILVEKLQNEVGRKSVDIYPYITLCTLDIICESAMGTSINAQNDDKSDYVQSVKAMCRIVMERALFVLQMFDTTFPLTRNFYTQKKSLRILHHQTNSVITTRKKELEDKKEEKNEDDTFLPKSKKAFLDLLLHATVDGEPLTQEAIREEVDTFMFEGHDTTASAIGFALYCLANNPDIQRQVLEEQQALFQDVKNPEITLTDLQGMKYLELVIKETLRLYPSVPIYARKTNEPVTYNGKTIPKGITIALFAFAIHRNPKYFANPEKFDPNRFENLDGTLPYAYIPFSAGPRNCIGQKFAMLEMKSTISKVIRNFKLTPAYPQHNLVLASESVLKSHNGIKIGLKARH